MTTNLDEDLNTLDAALAVAEKHAQTVLKTVHALRKQAEKGEIAGLPRKLEQLPTAAEPLAEALRAAGASFSYEADAAFAGGAYLRELQSEASRKGVVIVEREGRITAFPLLLKLEAATSGVRVGRKLEKQIRPSVLTAHLKKAQDSSGFNAEAFLEMLFRAATPLARSDAHDDAPRAGAVVPLIDIYDLLTLRPGAAAEYSREAFAVDLLRLDRAPDARTKQGFAFSLPASTGSKGRSRLTVYDEHGAEHVYVGIAFRHPALGREQTEA